MTFTVKTAIFWLGCLGRTLGTPARSQLFEQAELPESGWLVKRSIGNWLPKDRNVLQRWVSNRMDEARMQYNGTLSPVLQEFQEVIHRHPELERLGNAMFQEVPSKPPYNETPSGNPSLHDFSEMLMILDHIIKRGPQFSDKKDPPTASSVIGFPINAILDWPMGTLAGYDFFLSPIVNAQLRNVLTFRCRGSSC